MEGYLLAMAVLLPAFSAALCYVLRNDKIRNAIVVLSTLVMFVVAGKFFMLLNSSNSGKIIINLQHSLINVEIIGWIIKILDIALMVYIMYIGAVKVKKWYIVALTLAQLIPLLYFEIFKHVPEVEEAFIIDSLSLVMILLISIIGPIITVFAMGYMKEHEHHLHLTKSRQPRFFMILFGFLSAMNALVMTNNLVWLYFFWEVTTLCSFLLISHDGNEIAVKNATRALWMNLLGGVGFVAGIIIAYSEKSSIAVSQISSLQSAGIMTGLFPLALGLLCFAGFTKSAQFPFQGWLLGAMVAPTPVSALLHSSTMVKAGVYLIVRLSPAYYGTTLATVISVVGAFTFLAGSAVAISQSNAKRVLAYSTIANLGLIICCAGMRSVVAWGAAIMLMVFHAVSKGLLFLCVGTIENEIGSRDIEDMQGLMKRMPFTTVITVIGAISMLLPPFGALITKWLALEASVSNPLVLLMLVLGSALTVVFWSKWIGIMLTMSYKPKHVTEKLPPSMKSALIMMITLVIASAVLIVPMFNNFVRPYMRALGVPDEVGIRGTDFGIAWGNGSEAVYGGFASILFFAVVLLVMLTIPLYFKRVKPDTIRPPYLCGENTTDEKGIEFTSVSDKVNNVVVRNYYMTGFFGEKNLTLWMNIISTGIILVMLGVVMR